MVLFTRVPYQNKPMRGIVYHIKQETGITDVISSKHFKINVPSTARLQYPKYVLGIDNENYTSYWSTVENESNKYISFQMKYAIHLEGIGIACSRIDWYTQYRIETSLDLIEWDYNSTITVPENSKSQHLYFPLSHGKRCRFLKLTPLGSSIKNVNFAIYGIDFFGRIINPNNTCKQTYNHNIVYIFILLIVKYK